MFTFSLIHFYSHRYVLHGTIYHRAVTHKAQIIPIIFRNLRNREDFRIWAKREQIYVDGEAFVKVEIQSSFTHPMLRLSIEQRFEIKEPLSDAQLKIRMFCEGVVL